MKKKKKNTKSEFQKNIISVMRLCTMLLAGVSFWATSQGMINYVFSTEWQAYIASLGIQGLLLGLNFYFPVFWHYSINHKYLTRSILSLLTVVVLFCSSWFSYIYIVEKVYDESWEVDSRIQTQSAYRKGVYNGQDYTKAYQDELAEEINNQVLELYLQAKNLENDKIDVSDDIDWEQERSNYTGENFEAKDVMISLINAMEAATSEAATAETREQAMQIVLELKRDIEIEIESLEGQIEYTNISINNANENLQSAQTRLNRAPDEVDNAPLITAVERAMENLQNQQETLQRLQNRLGDYRTAYSRVQFYEINIGLADGGTGNLISAELRNVQQELFKSDPDIAALEKSVSDIFQRLQSTVEISINDNEEYQQLLVMMDSLINRMNNYESVKAAHAKFYELTDKMRSEGSILGGNESDNEWKNEWLDEIDKLKALISSLPTYGGDNTMLRSYNRAKEVDNLDKVLRTYITNHNAVQQGLIYLFSPYKQLAIFSLLLAIFLDIASFITGLVISIMDNNIERGQNDEFIQEDDEEDDEDEYDYIQKLSVMNKYYYLTGDYIKESDRTIYRAIEDGDKVEIKQSGDILSEGMYVERDGKLEEIVKEQNLKLVYNPQDGIYMKAAILYRNCTLSIAYGTDKNYNFVANVDPEIPVYLINKNGCNEILVSSINIQEGNLIVVALDQKGSVVAAIYVLD